MQKFKWKLMFIIGMIGTFKAQSQEWAPWPSGTTSSDIWRTATVSIGTSNTVPTITGASNHLLIVGFGSGANGNIGQWHTGTYGDVVTSSYANEKWSNLGINLYPTSNLSVGDYLSYGLRLQGGEVDPVGLQPNDTYFDF